MRKIFEKAMTVALSATMVASVFAGVPATVKAAEGEVATLTNWSLYQAGSVPDNWGDVGDLSQLESLTFGDGTAFTKDQLVTATYDTATKSVLGGYTETGSNSGTFTANIISNGWQANYAPVASLSSNNPWTIHMDMNNVKLNAAEKYNLDFSAVVEESASFDVKYANIVISDSDTNVYLAETISIGKEAADYHYTFSVTDQATVNIQIFLGAFPVVKDTVTTAEANFAGVVTFSNITLTDTGVMADGVYKVDFVNNGKTIKQTTVKEDNTVVAPTVSKKGYKFLGWYNGSKKFDVTTPVSESMTLTAKWAKVTTPARAKITNLASNKARSIKITVKKASGVKGFMAQLSLKKNFKKVAKKVSFTSKTKTVTKLKSGYKYFVRVKAYKVDSTGKKYWSTKWSTIKSVWAN